MQRLCNALLTKREDVIWRFLETMAVITRLTITRLLTLSPSSTTCLDVLPLALLVNVISDMTPTKDQKWEHFCESFQDVFDVVFGNAPLSCSNGLKFSWVFDVFIKSPVLHSIDFKAIDSTTRFDRSALHSAVLGSGVVKYLARFHATTTSSPSHATTISPTPPPDLLVDETQSRIDARRRPVAGQQQTLPPPLRRRVGYVHLIGILGTRIPDTQTQRDGCGRSPLHVAVVMNDALGVMELLPLGVPTQTRDIRGLPPPSPPDTAGSSARTTSTGRAGQWVVLKRVRALVPYDTYDPTPPRPSGSRLSGQHLPTPPDIAP